MKAAVLVDSERPKVSQGEVVSILKRSGIDHSQASPDFGVADDTTMPRCKSWWTT